jgi:hypothetical protein
MLPPSTSTSAGLQKRAGRASGAELIPNSSVQVMVVDANAVSARVR